MNNSELAEYKTRIVKSDETLSTKAIEFHKSTHEHSRILFESFNINTNIKKGKILEIGGSNSQNSMTFFPEFEYLNLDIDYNENLPTIVGDITKPIDLPNNSFDIIVSHQTFEHINEPWKAAQEIVRLLKPGGFCYISTVWSWRYHPVPIDYWRFSPDCLAFLFRDLQKLESNFNVGPRRYNIQGLWPNLADAVPVDYLGGWRENWLVYYAGTKPQ
ncbi:class I SAM-dependent methyltransferase [Nodularia chucula]|uniref:class I SAM-dependent methyltransferase n=1 Tax=Nodularia chucula TaxID=3093667 RepID=UPI0039C6B7B7